MIKIVVTDSGGDEHIFNSEEDVELYFDLRPESECECNRRIDGIKITTRVFENKKLETELESIFIRPRRVDVLFTNR